MSLMYIFSNTLDNIANAIRNRLNVPSEYYPSEMPNAINNIRVNRLQYMYGVLNNEQFCGDRILDMENAFYGHNSLSGNAVCGNAVYTMANAFALCTGISNAYCGPSVTNMQAAFYGCTGLKNNAEAVEGVIDMRSAYEGCSGLTNAVCPDTVINMASCYKGCQSMICDPVCGSSVENMYQAYSGCLYLGNGNEEIRTTGRAACGPNVINMAEAYNNCRALKIGNIGTQVNDISNAYRNCTNLTGVETVPSMHIDKADYAFYNCSNLTSCGDIEAESAREMFYNCVNLKNIGFLKIKDATRMFYNTYNARYADSPLGFPGDIEIMDHMFDNAYGCMSPLITKSVISIDNVYSGAKYKNSMLYSLYLENTNPQEPSIIEEYAKRASANNITVNQEIFRELQYPRLMHAQTAFNGLSNLVGFNALTDYERSDYFIPSGMSMKAINRMYDGTDIYGNFYIYGNELEHFEGVFANRIAPEGYDPNEANKFHPTGLWPRLMQPRLNIICENYEMFSRILFPVDAGEDSWILGRNHQADWHENKTGLSIMTAKMPIECYDTASNVNLYFEPNMYENNLNFTPENIAETHLKMAYIYNYYKHRAHPDDENQTDSNTNNESDTEDKYNYYKNMYS